METKWVWGTVKWVGKNLKSQVDTALVCKGCELDVLDCLRIKNFYYIGNFLLEVKYYTQLYKNDKNEFLYNFNTMKRWQHQCLSIQSMLYLTLVFFIVFIKFKQRSFANHLANSSFVLTALLHTFSGITAIHWPYISWPPLHILAKHSQISRSMPTN